LGNVNLFPSAKIIFPSRKEAKKLPYMQFYKIRRLSYKPVTTLMGFFIFSTKVFHSRHKNCFSYYEVGAVPAQLQAAFQLQAASQLQVRFWNASESRRRLEFPRRRC